MYIRTCTCICCSVVIGHFHAGERKGKGGQRGGNGRHIVLIEP